jgi:hypothetical protein
VTCEVGGEGESEGGGEMVVDERENEHKSTVMWLMGVSKSACPHR